MIVIFILNFILYKRISDIIFIDLGYGIPYGKLKIYIIIIIEYIRNRQKKNDNLF